VRDLILKIDEVARYHAAYPQACHAINNLRDHLSAIAFAEEVNRRGLDAAPESTLYRR
jgi:hypothetical protein